MLTINIRSTLYLEVDGPEIREKEVREKNFSYKLDT